MIPMSALFPDLFPDSHYDLALTLPAKRAAVKGPKQAAEKGFVVPPSGGISKSEGPWILRF